MATKAQITGMRGVYLVAAELSRREFIVSPTSRGAAGADLLVTDAACSKTFSVQVKMNARNGSHWLISEKNLRAQSKTHIYVFVNVRRVDKQDAYDYFVVPSAAVCRLAGTYVRPNSTFYSVQRADLLKYKQEAAWEIFGSAA